MRFATPPPRPLSWRALVVAGIALTILQLFFLHVVIPSGALRPVAAATHGLLQTTLIANLAIALVVVGVVLVGLHRQRPRDLGLPGGIGAAIAVTAMVWVVLNLLEVADGWRSGGLALDHRWVTRPTGLVGQWIAVTFGTALLEEILFRGVLLRQLFVHLSARRGFRSIGAVPALIVALVVSQALFAAAHLPALMIADPGSLLAPLQGLFVAGCALALLYVATGNLALCIGIHGLADAPTLLVVDRWDLLDHQTFVVATCVALVAFRLNGDRLRPRD